jgi:hypothetical protein
LLAVGVEIPHGGKEANLVSAIYHSESIHQIIKYNMWVIYIIKRRWMDTLSLVSNLFASGKRLLSTDARKTSASFSNAWISAIDTDMIIEEIALGGGGICEISKTGPTTKPSILIG